MLLSQMLAAALSLSANTSALDPVDTARNAFNTCLRAIVDSGVTGHKSVAEVRTQVTSGCSAEEAAYRAAMIRSDLSARVPQAEAERNAGLEIEDSRENARQQYQDAQPR